MKIILAIGLMTIIAGCSTTSGMNATTSISSFDGVKSVGVQAHSSACTSFVCPMLGATWLDNQPDNVGFSVQLFNEIANIQSVAFNIDGNIIKINALLPTDFDQEAGINISRTSIVTSYSILTKILQSKRTWMKVSTTKGSHEVAIIDGSLDSKAFHALKRFDTQVKEASSKEKLSLNR